MSLRGPSLWAESHTPVLPRAAYPKGPLIRTYLFSPACSPPIDALTHPHLDAHLHLPACTLTHMHTLVLTLIHTHMHTLTLHSHTA